jgi:hypothetical protein
MVLARRVGHMAPKEVAELLGVSDEVVDDRSNNSSRRDKFFSDMVNLSPRGMRESTAVKGPEDPFVDSFAMSSGPSNPFRACLTLGYNGGDEDEGDEDEDEDEEN